MGAIVTVRNINGLVLREEVSKVHELIVLNLFQLGFGYGRGGERVTIMSPRVRIIRTCGGGLLLALGRSIRRRRSWWSVVGW